MKNNLKEVLAKTIGPIIFVILIIIALLSLFTFGSTILRFEKDQRSIKYNVVLFNHDLHQMIIYEDVNGIVTMENTLKFKKDGINYMYSGPLYTIQEVKGTVN